MNREQEKNYNRNYFARAQWGIIKSKWWTKSCFSSKKRNNVRQHLFQRIIFIKKSPSSKLST